MLAEHGWAALTVERVAARAGVGKATVYRHWRGAADLVEDAFATLRPPLEPPPGPDPVQRIEALLVLLAEALADSTWSRVLPALIAAAEHDPEVAALHRQLTAERRGVVLGLLAEARDAGRLAPGADLDVLAHALTGPLFLARLLLHEPFPAERVPALVEQLLGPGCRGLPDRVTPGA